LINWGNWRVQIDLDKHDPIWINDEIKEAFALRVAVIVIGVYGGLLTVCFIASFIYRMKNKEAS
jgi:hypothetical protein